MISLLDVSRSGYYKWAAAQAAGPTPSAIRRVTLDAKVAAFHKASDDVYGTPRILADLREDGETVSRKTVAASMRRQRLHGISPRKFTPVTTIPDKSRAHPEDLVDRVWDTGQLDRVWTSDITYLPTGQGWVYLCAVRDGCSRRVIGWAMADHMRTELVTAALNMAVAFRGHRPPKVVFHADRGTQGGFNWSSQHLESEVGMGRPAGWMTSLTGRSPMKSPGAPAHRREVQRQFWIEIAKGLWAEDAAEVVGVSPAVGARWFRHAGGMSPFERPGLSGRYLSFGEREEIALLKAQNAGVREIARRVRRDPSTISRELRRNAATRGGKLEYRASVAQWKADLVAQRPKTAKLVLNDRLREYVQQRLSGQVCQPDGTVVAGPVTEPWNGRGKPHRGDRRWVTGWSPEQIANRLKLDFPDDESMRISHEAIYQALYIQSRGALKRELVACLRTGRALRAPRARASRKAWAHVTPEVMISERPAEVEDRAVPGHWEGDLMIGLERSAIGTLVERMTRFTTLIHLPREDGYGVIPRTKNGPPLAGYGAITMKNALADAITTLPGTTASISDLGPRQRTIRARPVQGSRPAFRSTSPILKAHGSAARTKTPMDCCASTSPRAPTSRGGPAQTFRRSPTR